MTFTEELRNLINKYSHTPDYLLANYLESCLKAFDEAVSARTKWYFPRQGPQQNNPAQPEALR
jgi:hypothetical protein